MTDDGNELSANKKVVAAFLQAFSDGNIPGLLALMHDQGNWWVSGSLPGISGHYDKIKFATLLQAVGQAYKGGALKITPTVMTAEADRVAVEATSYAELLNDRVYRNLYHFLFVIADGQVKEVKEYMDTQHAFDIFVAP